MKTKNTKRNAIVDIYPNITHLAAEDGGPLCRTNGVNAKNIVPHTATCNSCNKRAKRK
jgi:hypothetical protein